MQASVIIPAYNVEAHIARAIRSALRQTASRLEVIVIDDGSTDRTADIVRRLAGLDRRVSLLRHDRNRGAAAARNTGLDAAGGYWLALLDADDWYHPARLERLIAEAERRGANAIADNQHFTFDADFRPWRLLFPRSCPPSLDLIEFLRRDRPGIIGNSGQLKPVFRLEFLRKHGIRYDERIPSTQDFYFLLAALIELGHVELLADPLYYYRIQPSSLSRSPSERFYQDAGAAAGRYAAILRSRSLDHAALLLERRQAVLASQADYKAFLASTLQSPSAAVRLLRSGCLRRSVAKGLGRSLLARTQFTFGHLAGRLLWAAGVRAAEPGELS